MSIAKQLSVFVQNKVGSVNMLCGSLSKAGVNIHAISMVDDLEWGIVRLVVDDTKTTKRILEELGLTYGETQVLTTKIDNHAGALAEMADKLARQQISIDQLFATATGASTVVVLVTSDDTAADAILNPPA